MPTPVRTRRNPLRPVYLNPASVTYPLTGNTTVLVLPPAGMSTTPLASLAVVRVRRNRRRPIDLTPSGAFSLVTVVGPGSGMPGAPPGPPFGTGSFDSTPWDTAPWDAETAAPVRMRRNVNRPTRLAG